MRVQKVSSDGSTQHQQQQQQQQQQSVYVAGGDTQLAVASMCQFQLDEAIDLSGKLFDELVANRVNHRNHRNHRQHQPHQEGNYEILRKLSIRKIMLEGLSNDLSKRGVLPVTLNTLSTLFANAFLRTTLS
jgi:hypothetical protein